MIYAKKTRRGLTLLELVIVLAILAALAGLLLPLAGTYLAKAHAGACTTNHKDISKVVQQYNTVTRSYPNNLDSLQSADGTLFASMPGGGPYFTIFPLTADQVDALAESGITGLLLHDNATSESATFDSTSSALPLATGVNVATISAADVLAVSGYTSDTAGTARYAVFGVGHDTDLIGEWMQEAPYHFPEEGNPNSEYNRFGLIFDISEEDDGGATNADARAHFVGTVSFKSEGVEGAIDSLAEFFEN